MVEVTTKWSAGDIFVITEMALTAQKRCSNMILRLRLNMFDFDTMVNYIISEDW
jgi:hypothetical protein